jgi:hypothetical protein
MAKTNVMQNVVQYGVYVGFALILYAILYLFRALSDMEKVIEKSDKQDESISTLWRKYGDIDSRIDSMEAGVRADIEINKTWLRAVEKQQDSAALDIRILRSLHLQ